MKKEIRNISEDGKTVQITIADERWYIKSDYDADGKLVSFKEYPSVTWIADNYPKGIGFYQWLANKGWDEAESLKESAGESGSKVHHAITDLLLGNTIKIDDKIMNFDTGNMDEIKLQEYEAMMSFIEWFTEVKPKTLVNELTVFNEEHIYAGTADYICEIDGVKWLIDFKTSAQIWPSHELQLSAYAHALPPELKPHKMAILQVGYKKNKFKKWKFTEIPDQFELFLAAKLIWKKECSATQIFVKDYPTSISLS